MIFKLESSSECFRTVHLKSSEIDFRGSVLEGKVSCWNRYLLESRAV